VRSLFPLIALIFLLSGCSSRQERGLPPPSVLELAGARALESGRPVEAKEIFQQGLAESGGRAFLSAVGAARADIAMRSWAAYAQSMRLALMSMPPTPEADDLIGRTFLEAAQIRGGDEGQNGAAMAATFFSRARRRGANIPGLSYHVGLCKLKQGRIRDAVPYFERSLLESPETTEALGALVRSLRQLKAKERLVRLLGPLEKKGTLPPTLLPHLVWARQAD